MHFSTLHAVALMRSQRGRTALHIAAIEDLRDIAELLLTKNASVKTKTYVWRCCFLLLTTIPYSVNAGW